MDSKMLSKMDSKFAFELFQWLKKKWKHHSLRIHIAHKKTTSCLHCGPRQISPMGPHIGKQRNTVDVFTTLFLHMAVCFNRYLNVSRYQSPKVKFSLKGFWTGDSFAPQGILDNICRHFWFSQLEEGCCATGI